MRPGLAPQERHRALHHRASTGTVPAPRAARVLSDGGRDPSARRQKALHEPGHQVRAREGLAWDARGRGVGPRPEGREWARPPGSSGEISLLLPHLSTAGRREQGEEATRAKSMKSWKLRLRRGGHACPGNGMNSGRRLFPLVAMVMRGGQGGRQAFPFQGPGRAQASVRKMPAAWAPGAKNPGPAPPLQIWGSRPPGPPRSDLGVQAPQPLPPQTRGSRHPAPPPSDPGA